MKRLILTVVAAIAMTGCNRDIGASPLAAYDLTDREVVNSVLRELSPQDRRPFLTFTIHHLATSKAFCGEVLVDKQGRQPSTISDAIRMTITRENDLARRSRPVDIATLGPADRFYHDLAALQKEREQLIDRRETMLMIEPNAKTSDRYRHLEKQIAASSQKLAELRANAPAGARLY